VHDDLESTADARDVADMILAPVLESRRKPQAEKRPIPKDEVRKKRSEVKPTIARRMDQRNDIGAMILASPDQVTHKCRDAVQLCIRHGPSHHESESAAPLLNSAACVTPRPTQHQDKPNQVLLETVPPAALVFPRFVR